MADADSIGVPLPPDPVPPSVPDLQSVDIRPPLGDLPSMGSADPDAPSLPLPLSTFAKAVAEYNPTIYNPFEPQLDPRGKAPISFHMDQFFGKIQGCLGGGTPDEFDVEFITGYVVCTRFGIVTKILDAEVVLNSNAPPEGYQLRISTDDPEYPVVGGITETFVDLEDSFKEEIGANNVKLYVALALNWASNLVP